MPADRLEDVRKTLREGRIFAIVTARGHAASTIREAVKIFIDEVLTPEEREDLFDEVQALINEQLTPTARYVLSHHDYCGESVADIAAHLGTSETAVRMHLSRARRAIRECYHKRHHQTP